MFNKDFYPTPTEVIERMLQGVNIENKVILEPSAGKGNIIEYLQTNGAKEVIACENNADLKTIIQSKCKLIAEDFLTLTSEQISHIDLIVMNPPFSAGVEHILHAYNIAPNGCKIIGLCNSSNLENTYTNSRKELKSIVDNYGQTDSLENCFTDSERSTEVKVSLITIQKPGESYKSEFEGFFLEDDPQEEQENGIMSYNVVRDLVNRYVASVKLYDQQLETGLKMHDLLNSFYGENLGFTCSKKGMPLLRNDFKKDLQKAGWKFIFNKMDMAKYSTRGVREDINKFVEQQSNIPFTMRNIYKMLEIVVGTASQRMDKSLLEVFDKLTQHHSDNRYNVEGWKTNSHYLVGKKFILPYMINPATEYGYTTDVYRSLSGYSRDNTISDFEKALCFVTGKNYENILTLSDSIKNNTYGEWYESEYFKYKGYKKGSMHFEFKDSDVWAMFNQRIAKLKGYPLFEGKKQTKYQDRQTGRAQQEKRNPAHQYKPAVLFEMKINKAI